MKGYPALYFPDMKRFEPLSAFGDRACLVGRSPSANIVIPDPTCAREHFTISASAGGYSVEPLSRNAPTLHNGIQLSGGANLRHNDRLTFGFTTAVYLERDSDEFTHAQETVVGDLREELGARRNTAEIRLDRDRILGRAPGRDEIVLDHPRVSRKHAEVRLADGKAFLRDLGSTYGTFVNGERIAGVRELCRSDRIDIDPFSFRFTGHSLLPSSREGKLRVLGRNLTVIVRDHSNGEKKKCILDDVSLVVEPGEFVCILGASGSGKSTVMKALSARALVEKDTLLVGTVFLNELSLYANFQALKQSIALVPQKDLLYEDLTLKECISYAAKLRLPADSSDGDIKDAVEQAMERVGLKDLASTPIRHLSGGQKKRAALANETVSRPDLLFLDEVTSGLDEGTDWEMMDLFRRLARHYGMTIICVTHTVANVDLCDKIAVMTSSEDEDRWGPGLLAYYGPPAGARRWFGIEKLGEVYRKLPASEGRQWRDRYLDSEEFQRYIGRPLNSARLEQPEDARPSTTSNHAQYPITELIRQLRILAMRYSRLFLADRGTLKTAAAQSALIGVFLWMVFGGAVDPGKKSSLLFFLGISCFWCGCNNASKEIVKEQAMYRIERDINLSLTSYIASKIIVLVVFGVLQVLLLFGIVRIFGTVPGDNLQQFLCMCVSVMAGTSTGLFLSSLARTEDQASTLVPIALIPQILLSGVVVPDLRPIPDFIAHAVISGFWVSRSMQAVLSGTPAMVREAMTVLAVHSVCLWGASWWVLRNRDSHARSLTR